MGAQVNMSQRSHESIAMCQHGPNMSIQDIAKLEGDRVEGT
jgi:hypothetical protein